MHRLDGFLHNWGTVKTQIWLETDLSCIFSFSNENIYDSIPSKPVSSHIWVLTVPWFCRNPSYLCMTHLNHTQTVLLLKEALEYDITMPVKSPFMAWCINYAEILPIYTWVSLSSINKYSNHWNQHRNSFPRVYDMTVPTKIQFLA